MFVGFDYGSANCAIGVIEDGEVRLVPLSGDSKYLSSTLYAMDRELIAEAVLNQLPQEQKAEYARARAAQLSRAQAARRELDLLPNEQAVFVGEQAIEAYLDLPDEGFYVRSPKSFLGATGLRDSQIALFEDIVTLMMMHIKQQAESNFSKAVQITHAVIGRPVNFQGIGGEQSNQQAEAILSLAAKRAGFTEVDFLFEPLAAGMDYEASLDENLTVLVVDVGGGTTDCSMVKMGPNHIDNRDRSADFLGHSGQRIGGNDLDIALSMASFMPHLGLGSLMVNQLPVPSKPFWNAVAVNDISAQRDFSALASKKLIEDLIKDAQKPELILRLLKVQKEQLGYKLVRSAEQSKIALSSDASVDTPLEYIHGGLHARVSEQDFENAITIPLSKVEALMREALEQAGVMPDRIYVTGGTARSPAIYKRISGLFPEIPIVVGDHFGSVTAGLTRWAQRVFA
ncbi:molecular chaperone [Shewanella schlegeliana]|uniref:Molecular chaperone n=1 Tax=Shewanella schlegeliana TaxID=190308 RepID=A0ABS1STJ3_9GAMM|nr:molecular chaperone [Shewanella schlegeliana]MBL4911863.1 molecular chaperone [Shewanella schlegeliana]MCL1110184.1 molecular chaperone [Shewanella schlegeliana]GIU27108.1 molecular chaperone [Shewanella schlegeliana]